MKTVIFDMDGVIIDSEHIHCEAWIKTYYELGITIDSEYYFRKIQGNHGLTSTKLVLKEFNRDANNDMLILQKEIHASKLLLKNPCAIPGVLELINDLHECGYKLGLASASGMKAVNAVLTSLNLEDKFMVIHGGQAVSEGKPSPKIYLKTAQLLESEPDECVVIEDSKSGVIAAKSAGMKCIAVLNGRNKREDLTHADLILDSISKVNKELIESL